MDEKERLETFIEKAEELLHSKYSSDIMSSSPSSRLEMVKGFPMTFERIGPDEESLKSFILTIRLFCQDRDKISLREMDKMVQGLAVKQDFKDEFALTRQKFNDLLESPPGVKVESGEPVDVKSGKRLNKGIIFGTLMYGRYAHVREEKKKILDEWRDKPYFPDIQIEFDIILRNFLITVQKLKKICENILKEIT